MTAITTSHRAQPAPPAAAKGVRVTIGRVVSAEWVKFRGTRSTWWILTASVLSIVAAGVSPAVTLLLAPDAVKDAGSDPTGGSLEGISFTQLLIAALGVVVVSSEYGSGLIRATFTAVPTRLPVIWGKTVVVAIVTFAVTLVAVLVAFFSAQAVLAAADTPISLGDPGVLRAVVGAALFLAVNAIIGVGFGWLVRNTAGALAALVGFLFILPALGQLAPAIAPYLPSNAGAAITQTAPSAGEIPPWLGLGIFAAYAGAILVSAGYAVRRRDA